MSNSFTYLEKTALIIKPSLPYKISHQRFLLLKPGLPGSQRWKGEKNKTMERQRHSRRDEGDETGGLKSAVGQREMGLDGDQV